MSSVFSIASTGRRVSLLLCMAFSLTSARTGPLTGQRLGVLAAVSDIPEYRICPPERGAFTRDTPLTAGRSSKDDYPSIRPTRTATGLERAEPTKSAFRGETGHIGTTPPPEASREPPRSRRGAAC